MLAIIQFGGCQKFIPKFEKPKCLMLGFLFLITIYLKCRKSVIKHITKEVRLGILSLPPRDNLPTAPHLYLIFTVSGSEASHLRGVH